MASSGKIGKHSFLRLGRREVPLAPYENFLHTFPTSTLRGTYLQHVRGADESSFGLGGRFLSLDVKPTVICVIDKSGSMNDTEEIDPSVDFVITSACEDLQALTPDEGIQTLLVQMPGDPVDSAGEAWLHLVGRVGEEVEFNNWWAGDILFLTFSNEAISAYYEESDPPGEYIGPNATYWEQYGWLADETSTSAPVYHNFTNYRTLGVKCWALPRFGDAGGPPFTFSETYSTHLEEAITGTGEHDGFPLDGFGDWEYMGEVSHEDITGESLLDVVVAYFDTVTDIS